MKFIDIAFGATLVAFGLGSLLGALITASSPPFRAFMLFLLTSRVVAPVQAVTELGSIALTLLIFLNNCIPVTLSFVYPLIIGKVHWTPPLKAASRRRLLVGFSLLAASLLGFFNLGATLMLVAEIRGLGLVYALLRASWLHGPLEFLLVLACVAEPFRLTLRARNEAEIIRFLRADTKLLAICLIGLLASAAIEVFARV
jgi:hypothetical protein